MKAEIFKKGHLAKGSLVLPKTEKRNESLRKAAYKHNALQKLKPVTLDWGKKS